MNEQKIKECLLKLCEGHAGNYDGNKLKAQWKNESICLKYCENTENLKIFKALRQLSPLRKTPSI